jgi:hypothetical protein
VIWLLLAVLAAWMAFGPLVLAVAGLALLVPRVRWWVHDRVRVTRRAVGITALALLAVVAAVVVIPDGRLPIPPSPGVLAAPTYLGRPAAPKPVRADEVPAHPHLAANGLNSMHNDAWATDAYEVAGPLGRQPEVDTAWFGVEECATITFDREGRMVALCGDINGPSLHVIDPETRRKRASMDLPERQKSDKKPWEDLCGGAYMYLDNRDRAVLVTTDRQVRAVSTTNASGDPVLTTDEEWDLKPYVPHSDCLIALLPDWSGLIWWLSQDGLVGTIDPGSGDVKVHDLGESIYNSFAVDKAGAYVVSEEALYLLEAGGDGTPEVAWRAPYDRGAEKKPGQLSQGSGTTPTLLDDGVVAITDNAEPRMNVIFLRRDTGKEICKSPVFDKNRSATENSLVSLGDAVLVENNYGYRGPQSTMLGFATEPGIARVDLDGTDCETTWTSDLIAPTSVPKASWATGLAYVYTKRSTWTGVSAWYVTAVDVVTGRAMWSVRTGNGTQFNNHYAAMTLGPDGSLWIATMAGLVRVRDRGHGAESEGK